MTYTYKITFKHHISNIWAIGIFIIVFSFMPTYWINKYGSDDTHLYFMLCLIGFSIFLIPQLIIHLRYYSIDRGRTFYYTPNTGRIAIEIKDKMHKFGFDDIESIERNKSYALAADWFQWMPWDNYNYSVIKLTDGRQFVVTSLLVLQMDLPLEENKIQLYKRFYCYPFDVRERLEIEESAKIGSTETSIKMKSV